MVKLPPLQERFVRAYLADPALNATRAYQATYVNVKKSATVATAAAARLLACVKVQARIAELIAARNARLDMQADEVLERLTQIVRVPMTAFGSWGPGLDITAAVAAHAELTQARVAGDTDGMREAMAKLDAVFATKKQRVYFKSSDEIDPALAALIVEIRETKDGVALKLCSKDASLALLGKHHGLFPDKVSFDTSGLTDEQKLALLDLIEKVQPNGVGALRLVQGGKAA